MKIVGLTGGIGSGKSTVLNEFKDLGIKTYSADNAAKTLIKTDKALSLIHISEPTRPY